MGQQVRRLYNGAGQWTHEGNIMFDKEGVQMGQQVRRVYNGAGPWTHKRNIMFDKEGYSWDNKLDVYTMGLDNGPTKDI